MSLAIAIASSSSRKVMRREHRPEDLLARDAHRGLHAIEHRGLHVAAAGLAAHLRAAERQARALFAARIDVAQHALHLLRIDDRAQLRRRIERIAGREFARHLRHFSSSGSFRLSCTSSREPAEHISPWLKKIA